MKRIVGIICCVVFSPVVAMAFLMFYLPEWLMTKKTLREIHRGIWRL